MPDRAALVDSVRAKPWVAPRRETQDGRTLRTLKMTVLAQDPSTEVAGKPLTATVDVPADLIRPGPRTHRFHVVDWDPTEKRAANPLEVASGWDYCDRFGRKRPETLVDDRDFHAQNVFAIAARVLGQFEFVLGRRTPWSFSSPQLFLVPHAFADANAYYSRDDQAVLFGYVPTGENTTMYTCLSHDVVAHEVTHAVLDGIRPRLLEPGLADQPAFHEALADIVALLSVLSLEPVVVRLLAGDSTRTRISTSRVHEHSLKRSPLLGVAEELGAVLEPTRGQALRRSVELRPSKRWLTDPEFEEPHRRAEILVAAVMTTLVDMWTRRLAPIESGRTVDVLRAAEEGAKVAQHLLTMCIRSVDYCPPVELEFADVLNAILVADELVAPDDAHDYRGSLERSFAAYGIDRPAERGPVDVAPAYEHLNFDALRTSRAEAYRFIWQNAELLGLDVELYLAVERVLATSRVGPDGLRVEETLVDYTQMLDATARDLGKLGLDVDDIASDTAIQIWGGGVLGFDQFGNLQIHLRKPVLDMDRQQRRLDYLRRNALSDTSGRFGFSFGLAAGRDFAWLHAPRNREAW
jgi:hypothetical protein